MNRSTKEIGPESKTPAPGGHFTALTSTTAEEQRSPSLSEKDALHLSEVKTTKKQKKKQKQ